MNKTCFCKGFSKLSETDNHEIFDQLTIIKAIADSIYLKEYNIYSEKMWIKVIKISIDKILDVLINTR